MSDILIFAEVNDGVLHDTALQALSAAKAVVGGGKVKCLLAGQGVAAHAATLFECGADEVAVADDARLAAYVTRPYRQVACEWVKARPAGLVLMAASTVGNDLAPAVAAQLGAACVLDGDGIAAAGDGFTIKRAGYDRKVMTTFAAATGLPIVATVRDGVAAAPVADPSRSGQPVAVAVNLTERDTASKVLRRDVATKTVNLKDAKIIVAAGAGVGNPDGLAVVKELALALGAEVGATRAVVDAGWLPADHQIGQTGSTVRPSAYIACGISGAVQHRVGMLDSKKIVAINTDANAPIFRIAHFKIVGDLKVIVPKLVKLLQN
jgi:electron transfer flavoprotein alpha subunit